MRRYALVAVITSVLQVLLPALALAGPDRYVGDGSIYTGESTYVRPNVLIIFDNNSTMGNTASVGDPYNPATTYTGDYDPWTVYKVTGMSNYVSHITNASSALANVSCAAAKSALQTVGTYSGSGASSLKSDGTCGNGGAGLVYLGNLLNYNSSTGAGSTDAQVRVVRSAVLSIVNGTRGTINYGFMTFGENKSGGRVVRPVANISADAAYNTFASYLPGTGSTGTGTGGGGTYTEGPSPAVSLLSGNGRPLAEALYDAGAYFKNVYPVISNYDHVDSPIAYTCQKNYVIVITNGDTDLDSNPKLGQATALGTVGNYYTSDGYDESAGGHSYGTGTHYMDDVAKFIYDNDMSSSLSGTQRVVTHAVQVFAPLKTLVQSATIQGHGSYYVAADANAISNALTQIITSIVLETNSSFVAPVVPVSPENRTESGSRVYLGFFKPISGKPWLGNVKKYALDDNNEVIDKNGVLAMNSDGSIKSTATSYWSTSADGGNVDSGGVGQPLITQATRYIYTYTGTSTALTNSSNDFATTNTAITTATLGVSSTTEKDNLIGFVRGIDTYDDDGDSNTTEKRAWVLGDIMHSKPSVVNYASYTFSASNEANCSVNKTMIYVGGNDGMLHAFKDCDGSEAWAFIPQDLLVNLKYLREPSHAYFVDASPMVYTYDADRDGNIESGDKVILIFGLRRGGGKDVTPTGGFYYALDVSNSAAPVYMWKLGNSYSPSGTHTDYAEMGETWSDPKIGKVRIGTTDKVVAFVGAGYDNLNEDSRYGATQTFSGTGAVTASDLGSGEETSSGSSAPANAKGRGVYVIEIASLSGDGVPSFTNSGYKVWGYTYANNTNMSFSIPSDAVILDSDYNRYIDKLYIGDTGGNIWRFNIGDTNTSNWTVTKIFASNPGADGSSDIGRKIFYRPTVTMETGYTLLFFGTGDREHPLNRDVVDRMYSVKDTGQATPKTEADLVDLTADTLQTTSSSATISDILGDLSSAAGWYIKLNAFDSGGDQAGEKVLANPLLFGKHILFTTHYPNLGESTDPCAPGNLGHGLLYEMNYLTGEAVVNYDTTNDSGTAANSRASTTSGKILVRSDRVKTLGAGIPSAPTSVVRGNVATAFVGIGGGMSGSQLSGGDLIPIYWRQK